MSRVSAYASYHADVLVCAMRDYVMYSNNGKGCNSSWVMQTIHTPYVMALHHDQCLDIPCYCILYMAVL